MDGMKKFIGGVGISVLGTISLLRNVTISSGQKQGIGALLSELLGNNGSDVAKVSAAVMVLVIIAIFAVALKPCFVTFALFTLSVVIVMVNIVSGMKLIMADMPASDFVILFAMIAGGLALALNGSWHMQKAKKYEQDNYEDMYY